MKKEKLSTEELRARKSEREQLASQAKRYGIVLLKRAKFTDSERAERKKAAALAYYYRNAEKIGEYAAKWAAENKERRSEQGKAYEEKNKDKRRARKKIYRLENKDKTSAQYLENRVKVLANCASYYAANAEKIKANVRAYNAARPEKVLMMSRKKRAIKRGAGGVLSDGIVAKLMISQKKKCICCKADLTKKKHHLDHITPLSKGGMHTDFNVQLLCATCNLQKNAKDPIEFMQSRGFLL